MDTLGQPAHEQLILAIERLVSYLQQFNDSHWAAILSNNIVLLRRGDPHGAERFLEHYGGMGSLNDLWLCETNGHKVEPSSESCINLELSQLRSAAWQLACEVTHTV